MLAAGLLASLVATGTALAEEANQVTGVAVEQADGFASLSWDSVAGATDYQIERTPVNADDELTGPPVIVGLWRPNRTVTPDSPTFADAGFNPGDRFRWRVRARTGTTEHPFSDPVFGTTLPQWGDPDVPGENLRTQWEQTQAVQYTSDVNEYAYTAALDAASDRVRVVEIGRTIQNRPINMFIIGYPTPPRNVTAVAGSTVGAGQLQRARQRAVVPGGVPDHGPRAGIRRRPAHARHPGEHDRADRADDQRRRPRREHARQLHRPGSEPRLFADPRARDVRVRRDDARL